MGIIPARAGFTWVDTPQDYCHQDHPRSRGVYRTPEPRPRRRDGSSPLARGLHRAHADEGVSSRIIPARAGFTLHHHEIISASRDHPRSRGVYGHSALTARRIGGSSPLARGLPHLGVGGGSRGGIIPARAGFTYYSHTPENRSEDHPRSRGVYQALARKHVWEGGSSPLARGLPTTDFFVVADTRIIPARAGFTAIARLPPLELAGSSPLARGLHGAGGDERAETRIIPARAGFTRMRLWVGVGRKDHPRSRGVYSHQRQTIRSPSGSSPLARGLRQTLP